MSNCVAEEEQMNPEDMLQWIQRKTEVRNILPSIHGGERMEKREITAEDIYEAIASGQILEDYAASECCLILGFSRAGRPIHIVCTTSKTLKIITLYQPEPPDWVTPTEWGTL